MAGVNGSGAKGAPGRAALLALLLAAGVALAFGRSAWNDFVAWDDDLYLLDNPAVRGGLSAELVRFAFTTSRAGNWHPATWLSHGLDVELFGLAPGAHHLVSVALHAAAAVLFFLAFWRASDRLGPSFVAAALFAWHPLRVESVAWVSERKDVLAGLFLALTLLAHVRHAQRPSAGRLALVALFGLLGLLAKPTLVVLPLLLLLVDRWPLQRRAPWPRLVLEKAPLFAAAAVIAAATVATQGAEGATTNLERLPFLTRVANALVSCVLYLWQTLWPARLAALYPHPALLFEDPLAALSLPALGAAALLAVLGVAAWRLRGPQPWLAVGGAWYLVALLPVLGLVQVGLQARADRYTYLPSIGLGLALAFGGAEIARRSERWRRAVRGGAALALALFLAQSWRQVAVWRDTVTLFEHTARVSGENLLVRVKLGEGWLARGDLERAAAHYERALAIDPERAENLLVLGEIRLAQGHLERAFELLQRARARGADPAAVEHGLALVAHRRGDAREAERLYRAALARDPANGGAWNGLGEVLLLQEREDEALAAFRRVAELEPGNPDARFNLGVAYERRGAGEEAARAYRQALALDPGHAPSAARLRSLGR